MRLTSCIFALVALSTSEAALAPLGLLSVLLLPLVGRSRICPMLDFTTKSLPRYLLIVFALAGDSTMTSAFPMGIGVPQSMNAVARAAGADDPPRSEEHTSELQSRPHLVCRLLLEKKKKTKK